MKASTDAGSTPDAKSELVSVPLATFALVTALLAIFAEVTALLAIFADVTALLAILAEVTALFFSWALPTLFFGTVASTAAMLVPVSAISSAVQAITIAGDGRCRMILRTLNPLARRFATAAQHLARAARPTN
jgi:hypothetical protein